MISRAADRKRRLEASVEAVAAERRNRPSALIALALVLFLLACIYTVYASAQRARASSSMAASRNTLQDLANTRARIEAFQDSEAQRQLRRQFAPRMRNIRSTLEQIARSTGMADRLPQLGQISDQRKLGLDSPLLLRTIDATILEGDVDQSLEWIQAATDEIDGLFVSGVTLNPAPDGWRLTVKLSRWEIEQ